MIAPDRGLTDQASLVVLRLGGALEAEVVDESPVGVGFLLKSLTPTFDTPGQRIDIVHRGQRRSAAIADISRSRGGYVVDAEWCNS